MSGNCYVDNFTSYDTIYPAYTVEWCPILIYNNIFVCGTYKFDEVNRSKFGAINLFALDHRNDIRLIQSISGDGVLDLKWNSHYLNRRILLAAALSGKHISVYSLDKEETDLSLKIFANFELPHTSSDCHMSLSISWSCPDNYGSQYIAFSDSCGFISHVNLNDGLVRSFKAHDANAWTVTFNSRDLNILYSGGDDCKFKGFDRRIQCKPVFVNNEHQLGITTCSSSKTKNSIVTGSFDEIVRLWDSRNLKKSYSNVKVDGGIRTLDWEPIQERHLLSASMLNAVHIIDTSSNVANICHSFGEKLNRLYYGADWCHFGPSMKPKNKQLIATCTFHDHKLDLFFVDLKL